MKESIKTSHALLRNTVHVRETLNMLLNGANTDVTLICRDRKEVRVSSMLLRFLAPWTATLLQESSEMCLMLTYVDSEEVHNAHKDLISAAGDVEEEQLQRLNIVFNPLGAEFLNNCINPNPQLKQNYQVKTETLSEVEREESGPIQNVTGLLHIKTEYDAEVSNQSVNSVKIIPKSAVLPIEIPKEKGSVIQAEPMPNESQGMELICKECGEFMGIDSKIHMNFHIIEKMSCHCEEFAGETEEDQSYHIKCYHMEHFGCAQCMRTFQSKVAFNAHVHSNHSEIPDPRVISRKNNIEDGETFATKEEVMHRIQLYSDSNFSRFVSISGGFRARDQRYRMAFKCPHGVYRKSQSAGIRQVTSQYVGCPVSLNISQQHDKTYVVNKALLDHQEHEINEETYMKYRKKLNKDQELAVATYLETKPSNKEVALFLSDLCGVEFTTREAYHIVKRVIKRSIKLN